MPPTASVILSTHNSPRALELVLIGYAQQDCTGFEILIADDGSREETRALIRTLRDKLLAPRGIPLAHAWHAHKGYYGKLAIVNRAIVAAQSDYLILGDADVIPRPDYVRTHLALRSPRTFLAGGDFRLSPEVTPKVTPELIRSGDLFNYRALRALGQPATRRRIKLLPASWFTRAIDAINFSPARWSGSNASAWKSDLLRVGGFDETFHAPGKDDTELGYRLWHSGVRSRHVRHNAICLHLHHGQGNYSPEGRARNLELLNETIREKRTTARLGIPNIVPGDHTIERTTP